MTLPETGLDFLGHRFRPLGMGDKAALQDYLRRFPQRVSGYTFATLAAWAEPFGVMWARVGDECLLLSRTVGDERHLLQPIGRPSAECCRDLLAQAEHLPYPLRMMYVARDYIETNSEFCARFEAHEDRGAANYIYLARDLAELPGGRYSKKRNLIAQFQSLHPTWEAVPLDRDCGALCRQLLLEIGHTDGVTSDDHSLKDELLALDFTMAHFDELEQSGVVIRIDGRPVAFAIYERQNIETAAVHFEKALRTFKGLYQIVNRETARRILADKYHLINREEDVNDAGLRKAKLSYYPLDIYPVFNLVLKRAD